MTVIASIQAFRERMIDLHPHLVLPLAAYEMTAAELEELLLDELPGQAFSTEEWQERCQMTTEPSEASEVVLEWIQHRVETALKRDFVDEDGRLSEHWRPSAAWRTIES